MATQTRTRDGAPESEGVEVPVYQKPTSWVGGTAWVGSALFLSPKNDGTGRELFRRDNMIDHDSPIYSVSNFCTSQATTTDGWRSSSVRGDFSLFK